MKDAENEFKSDEYQEDNNHAAVVKDVEDKVGGD